MTTVNELLEAAGRADKAGDADAARALVQAAKGMMTQAPATSQQPAFDPLQPPRADAPGLADTRRTDQFGDTIIAATEGPRAAVGAFAGGLADQSQSPTMAALPEGTPGPLKRPLAAAGDLAMLGVTGLGTAIAGGAGLIGETFGGSPTQERKLAGDLMMGASVAVPELAGVSGTMRAGASAARAAERASVAPTARQAGARAADDLGITPSAGMNGKGWGMASAALEKTPWTAGIIAKDAARAVGEIEGVFQRIRGGIGKAVSADAAGDALQGGLSKFVAGFKDRAGKLFDAVDAKIPKATSVRLDTTAGAIADAKQYFQTNPALAQKLGLNQWDGIIEEAQTNGISWQAVKQFRSKIGEALGSNRGALADEDVERLKTLYGSLTQDMEAAARAAGPEAYKAWRTANGYYRAGANRIERSLDATITAKTPERAFEAFAALTKADRSTSDVRRMRQIRSSMPKDEWNTVSASIVDRLGRARAGAQNAEGDAFSPATFLTEWNRMSPEAKAILLPEDARIELGKLAQVAERAKAGGAERNFSNTGTVTVATAMGAGAMTAPLTTALTVGGTWASAKALTSPMFLRAMNAAARGDSRQIAAMARGNGPFAVDAQSVLRLTAAETAATSQPANERAAPLQAAR